MCSSDLELIARQRLKQSRELGKRAQNGLAAPVDACAERFGEQVHRQEHHAERGPFGSGLNKIADKAEADQPPLTPCCFANQPRGRTLITEWLQGPADLTAKQVNRVGQAGFAASIAPLQGAGEAFIRRKRKRCDQPSRRCLR